MLSKIIMALMVIVVAILFTVVAFFAVAHFTGAQEITCNWLWCEFKNTITEINQTCYLNNQLVNCSEITQTIH